MKLVYFLLAALLGAAPALHAQTEHAVLPAVADPQSGSPTNLHFAYINPAVTPKNKLFLFFPGTGGVALNYQLIARHAANLGYHAISLTYPSDVSINQLCVNVADTTCHSRARMEVFDGLDRHPGLAVDSFNCIRRRTLKLLQHLNAAFPAESWGQFYQGNTILWNRIAVGGHSQGGGHAGFISKLFAVDRVVLFAVADWITPLSRAADWVKASGPTASSRYYGFIHQSDEQVNFALEQLTWNKLGMAPWGAAVLTDAASPPYQNTHKLYTQLTPRTDPTKFHGSVVADAYTPLTGTTPTFQPVWTYLLEATPTALAARPALAPAPQPYPNPAADLLHLPVAEAGATYELRSPSGQVVQRGELTETLALSPQLASGLYFLLIYRPDGTLGSTSKLQKR